MKIREPEPISETKRDYSALAAQVLKLKKGYCLPVDCDTKTKAVSLVFCMKRRGLGARREGSTVYLTKEQ